MAARARRQRSHLRNASLARPRACGRVAPTLAAAGGRFPAAGRRRELRVWTYRVLCRFTRLFKLLQIHSLGGNVEKGRNPLHLALTLSAT